MSATIVLIAPAAVIPALREQLTEGADVRTFTDLETLVALDHIVRHKPRIIALEDGFVATPRGSALVERIKADPELGVCELRVMAHDGAFNRAGAKNKPGMPLAIAIAEPGGSVDRHGTRRERRTAIRETVQVLIDGNTATLVDLSVIGAQVLSAKMLKPNQRVRISFPDGDATIRCSGSIAWSAFEMPKGLPPHYRAGIAFTAADQEAIASYCQKYKRS